MDLTSNAPVQVALGDDDTAPTHEQPVQNATVRMKVETEPFGDETLRAGPSDGVLSRSEVVTVDARRAAAPVPLITTERHSSGAPTSEIPAAKVVAEISTTVRIPPPAVPPPAPPSVALTGPVPAAPVEPERATTPAFGPPFVKGSNRRWLVVAAVLLVAAIAVLVLFFRPPGS